MFTLDVERLRLMSRRYERELEVQITDGVYPLAQGRKAAPE
jgi:hypothetical protein